MNMTSGPIESNSRVKPVSRESYSKVDDFRPFFQEAFYQDKNNNKDSDQEESSTTDQEVDLGIKPASLRLRVYTKEQIRHELNRYLPIERNSIESAIGRVKRLITLESPH